MMISYIPIFYGGYLLNRKINDLYCRQIELEHYQLSLDVQIQKLKTFDKHNPMLSKVGMAPCMFSN